MSCDCKGIVIRRYLGTLIGTLCCTLQLAGMATAQTTFGGNAQHTANYSTPAQNLNAVHWTASVDLNNTGALAHYGAPVISHANTIFVPVKTGLSGGFRIDVFNAANGAAMYSLSTDYILPPFNWVPVYQPVLASSFAGTRLYYPGAGGTFYYIDNVDSAAHGAPVQQVFYTSIAGYHANAAAFNSTVFINTPITADSNGDVFFGFRVVGTAPSPLNTTQSGFARVDPSGNATYVLAGTAANDVNIGRDSHNSAPALSNDESTVYVVVKSAGTDTYGYLLGLDSNTLATKYKVFLKDPRANNANNATILDDSTASPTIGPDNDVYFGIFGNPYNGSRGFLLHFSSDLTVEKAPGGFGWDNTVGIVPASMVPSYTGTSSYLLFTKYNNYANAGADSGDGVNRIALLDPKATEVDARPSSNHMLIMREVLTVIGPTPDKEDRSALLPFAVREWCINTPAVNPATNSVFMPSEDGHMYRWNLVSNSLDQFIQLNPGVGLPYVPTVIGPDGQVYTTNGGILSAIGNINGVNITLASSVPDVRDGVAPQLATYTATVTNPGAGAVPTGTISLTDTTYTVPSPGVLTSTTTTLASNIPLDGTGHAAIPTSLSADKHFITASYSGDGVFSPGNAALVQYVHSGGTTTSLTSSPNPSNPNQAVTFTATSTATSGTRTPTGMVTFQDGSAVLAQLALNPSGVATFRTSTLTIGSHSVTATYASDSSLAASSGGTVQTVRSPVSTTTTLSSSANPTVFSQPVSFTATVSATGSTPTGTVTFKNGTANMGTSTVNGSGQATLTTSALPAGARSITAVYNGNSGFSSSTSDILTQTVNKDGTTTSVTSSLNPSMQSQSVTFTASVVANAPGASIPTGTVTFKDGNTTLGTKALSAGSASLAISTLSAGTHSITVLYQSNANFLASTSPVLVQTVN